MTAVGDDTPESRELYERWLASGRPSEQETDAGGMENHTLDLEYWRTTARGYRTIIVKQRTRLDRLRALATEAQYRNGASVHWTEIIEILDGAE